MQKTITTLIAVLALQAGVLHAQTNLFRMNFRAVCKPSGGGGGSSSMRNADLIRQCAGTGFSNRELRRNFALVYNSDADSIQVVNRTNGELVCDVFQFQGGTVVTNGDRLERLTFVFVPDQSDSVGSAVLRERATGTDVNDVNRARINGRIQFTMPEPLNAGTSEDTSTNTTDSIASTDTNNVSSGDSSTNNASDGSGDNSTVMPVQFVAASADVAPTNSNVQVCTGSFTVGRRLSLAEESQITGENASTNAATGEIQTGTAGTTVSTGTNGGTTTTIITTNSTTRVTNTTASMLPLLGF